MLSVRQEQRHSRNATWERRQPLSPIFGGNGVEFVGPTGLRKMAKKGPRSGGHIPAPILRGKEGDPQWISNFSPQNWGRKMAPYPGAPGCMHEAFFGRLSRAVLTLTHYKIDMSATYVLSMHCEPER